MFSCSHYYRSGFFNECLLQFWWIPELQHVQFIQVTSKAIDTVFYITTVNTMLYNCYYYQYCLHFYRAMLCIRGTSHGPVSVCLSVCLSQVGWVYMFITHCPTLTLQRHNFDLFRTCRTSSFCTVAWQLARFQLTRRIARSLGDRWASCCFPKGSQFGLPLCVIEADRRRIYLHVFV